MKTLELHDVADYLDTATIEQSINLGHVLVHVGTNAAGVRFAMMNDAHGQTALSEAL